MQDLDFYSMNVGLLRQILKDLPDSTKVLIEPHPEGTGFIASAEGDLHPCSIEVVDADGPGHPAFVRISTIYAYRKGFSQR